MRHPLPHSLAGAVAEEVSGKPWNVLFDELVGSPCGMQNTRFYNGNSDDPDPSNPCIAVSSRGQVTMLFAAPK